VKNAWLGITCDYGSALIYNNILCCESWGIIINGKEFRNFTDGAIIGATQTKFKHTGKNEKRNQDYAEAEFTAGDLGSCKFWCKHNGYYSHEVVLKFGSYKDSFEL
jgi:hypothetical protein